MAGYDPAAIGKRLRDARVARGIGMKAVFDPLGIAKQTLDHVERGTVRLTVGRLIDYSRALGAKPHELLPELHKQRPLGFTRAAEDRAALDEIPLEALLTICELAKISPCDLLVDVLHEGIGTQRAFDEARAKGAAS